jgi:hypothetical protein
VERNAEFARLGDRYCAGGIGTTLKQLQNTPGDVSHVNVGWLGCRAADDAFEACDGCSAHCSMGLENLKKIPTTLMLLARGTNFIVEPFCRCLFPSRIDGFMLQALPSSRSQRFPNLRISHGCSCFVDI